MNQNDKVRTKAAIRTIEKLYKLSASRKKNVAGGTK